MRRNDKVGRGIGIKDDMKKRRREEQTSVRASVLI
jgi:hypothetical protein